MHAIYCATIGLPAPSRVASPCLLYLPQQLPRITGAPTLRLQRALPRLPAELLVERLSAVSFPPSCSLSPRGDVVAASSVASPPGPLRFAWLWPRIALCRAGFERPCALVETRFSPFTKEMTQISEANLTAECRVVIIESPALVETPILRPCDEDPCCASTPSSPSSL
jgi:hypothetical protein